MSSNASESFNEISQDQKPVENGPNLSSALWNEMRAAFSSPMENSGAPNIASEVVFTNPFKNLSGSTSDAGDPKRSEGGENEPNSPDRQKTERDADGRIKSISSYNAAGKIEGKIEFDPVSGNKKSETTFYPDTGNKKSEIFYSKSGLKGMEAEFDANGDATKRTVYDTTTGKKNWETEYHPPDKSKSADDPLRQRACKQTEFDPLTGNKKFEATIGPNGRIASRTNYDSKKGFPTYAYEYDASGKQSRETVFSQKTGKKIYDVQSEDGKQTCLKTFDPQSGNQLSEVSYRYRYGSADGVTRTTFDPETGKKLKSTDFDSLGEMTGESHYRKDGSMLSRCEYRRDGSREKTGYNENGTVAYRVQLSKDNQLKVVQGPDAWKDKPPAVDELFPPAPAKGKK